MEQLLYECNQFILFCAQAYISEVTEHTKMSKEQRREKVTS